VPRSLYGSQQGGGEVYPGRCGREVYTMVGTSLGWWEGSMRLIVPLPKGLEDQ